MRPLIWIFSLLMLSVSAWARLPQQIYVNVGGGFAMLGKGLPASDATMSEAVSVYNAHKLHHNNTLSYKQNPSSSTLGVWGGEVGYLLSVKRPWALGMAIGYQNFAKQHGTSTFVAHSTSAPRSASGNLSSSKQLWDLMAVAQWRGAHWHAGLKAGAADIDVKSNLTVQGDSSLTSGLEVPPAQKFSVWQAALGFDAGYDWRYLSLGVQVLHTFGQQPSYAKVNHEWSPLAQIIPPLMTPANESDIKKVHSITSIMFTLGTHFSF